MPMQKRVNQLNYCYRTVVKLVDELITGSDPIFVIDRSAPIDPIDEAPYHTAGGVVLPA